MVAICGTAWWLEALSTPRLRRHRHQPAPRRCSGVQVSAVALCEYCGGARLARMLERTDACRDRSSMRCRARQLAFSLPHVADSLPLSLCTLSLFPLPRTGLLYWLGEPCTLRFSFIHRCSPVVSTTRCLDHFFPTTDLARRAGSSCDSGRLSSSSLSAQAKRNQ